MKNKIAEVKKLLSPIQRGVAMVVLMATTSTQAGIVARWDFEEAIDGQYGVESIVASTSSVNGVVATAFTNNPLYVRGADNVGHGMASGYLRGMTDDALFSGFKEFNISFDARLGANPAGTQVLMRYGVTTTSWNIYTTTGNRLYIEMYDGTGATFILNTFAAVIPADSAYHHYEIVWDGSFAQIKFDGVAQLLEDGSARLWPLTLGALRATGTGQLGIGGMIRDNLTAAYEFNGFLDNIVINNASGLTPPVLALEPVASWNFNGGSIGENIVSAIDSVSGLTAVTNINNGTANPKYVSGNGGNTAAGFGGSNGVLQVNDPSGILGANFTALKVTFDIDLAADMMTGSPVTLLRNGYLAENFNIFLQSNNIISVIMKDADGTTTSGSIKTAGRALSAAAGWQTVAVEWDGESIWILVDGVAQPLLSGGLFATVPLVSLLRADAPLGIGGLVRNNGTTGQYLNGSLDNILIEGIFPPLYTLTVNSGSGNGSYTNGHQVAISAAAVGGKTFASWAGDTQYVASASSASTTVTMPAQAVNLTATYVDNTYALTVTSGTGGGSYTNGHVQAIAAAVIGGKTFAAWTGATVYLADSNSSSTTVTMPAQTVSLTATYVDTTYALTVT
ncbi:MAG: hypothetical protein WCG03_07445, partial [Kiritimatiellales bacterium]